MLVARALYRPLLLVLALLCALMLAAPLLGARGGNSTTAQACQEGGWEELAPAEQPSVPFANQGACVSYGARGGVPVAVVTAPVANLEFIVRPGGGGAGTECYLRGWLEGDTEGIASVLMEVEFVGVTTDGETVSYVVPITLTPPAFDVTTEESYLYLIGVPASVSAEATYDDGSETPLATSFAPVGCGGYVP